MGIAIVEPVALRVPGLVIHLFPLLDWIDMYFDVGGLQRCWRGCSGWRSRSTRTVRQRPQSRDNPVVSLAVQGLLARERHRKISDAGKWNITLTSFQVVAVD